MLIYLLGLFDIITAILSLISLRYLTLKLSIFFIILLLFKWFYTLLMTMNLLDVMGLIDLLSGITYLIAINNSSFSIISTIFLILLLFKGLISFVKL